MDDNRLTKKIFMYCDLKSTPSCKNWNYSVKKYYRDIQMQHLCNITYNFDIPTCINDIRGIIFESHEQEWFAKINEPNGLGEGGKKLRTYCTFKDNFSPEPYVTCIVCKKHRSVMAKLRC